MLGFALEVHGVVIIVHGVGVLTLGLALLGALVVVEVVVVRVNHELRVALLARGSLGMWCMPKVGTLADEVSAATVVAFPGVALAEASPAVGARAAAPSARPPRYPKAPPTPSAATATSPSSAATASAQVRLASWAICSASCSA